MACDRRLRPFAAAVPALFGLALFGLALVGCVAPGDTDPPAGPPPENAFERRLFLEYVGLGDTERAEYDWRDAVEFYRRADRVAAGERVEPEAVAARDLPGTASPALAAARERLIAAFAAGARVLTPDAAARAQAGFDCWIQEQEENFQPDDIAACRERFDAAMAEVERTLDGALVVLLADPDGSVGSVLLANAAGEVRLSTERESAVTPGSDAAPGVTGTVSEQDVEEVFGSALAAAPEPPVTIRLYFEPGTDILTAESQAALPTVRDLVRDRVVPGVEIAGHTDRVGAAAVNDRLAFRRAQAVRDLLLEYGVSPRLVRADSFGERDPVVPTADGVEEPRNRRVEITVR